MNSPEAAQQPIPFRLETPAATLKIDEVLAEPSHIAGGRPGLVPFEGPTHGGIALGVIVDVLEHVELLDGEPLLVTKPLELVVDVEQASGDPAHQCGGVPWGCAGMAEW